MGMFAKRFTRLGMVEMWQGHKYVVWWLTYVAQVRWSYRGMLTKRAGYKIGSDRRCPSIEHDDCMVANVCCPCALELSRYVDEARR